MLEKISTHLESFEYNLKVPLLHDNLRWGKHLHQRIPSLM